MKRIAIQTSDNRIWNKSLIYSQITESVVLGEKFALDFLQEGPDIQSLGLYAFLDHLANKFNYSLKNITVFTANILEQHKEISIVYHPPIHLVKNAKDYIANTVKKNKLKHFGIFINRGNVHRLHLTSYLHKFFKEQSLINYHFHLNDDLHLSNIGLEEIVKRYNTKDVSMESDFLQHCPIKASNTDSIVIDKSLLLNPAQQLLVNDKESFVQLYQDFFVEIVCETYHTGQTFFPTEKIFRPILLKTPFIVQGPRFFLKNMEKLGFKTFSKWWNEAYSEDPDISQIIEIKRVINFLSKQNSDQLYQMYLDMQDTIEHNYSCALNLTANDFKKIK